MNILHTISAKKPSAIAASLLRLERRGLYNEALVEVEHMWKDISVSPDVAGLAQGEAAELLLRCGSLIGFHGLNEQIENSQLIAKDLLTDAHRRFSEMGEVEKVAECENQLAIVYTRTGEFNEADACLAASFGHNIPEISETRLHTHAITSLVNQGCNRHAENVKYEKLYEDVFREHASEYLKGIICANIGIAHKNLKNMSAAFKYLELSKYHYRLAHHKVYFATTENNLAMLYRDVRKFSKAHESIDNATRIFRQIKDKTREGFSFDTKALIYFSEAKYAEAFKTIEKGIAILRKSENVTHLIETLLTKATILLYLDKFSEAVMSLSEAVGMARVQTDDKAAMALIKRFETSLEERNKRPKPNLENGDFELILPQSIAHFSDYRGVWINNTQLESIGLAKGSLAVVAKTKVNRGDLVAVAEVENEAVSCGFYDADFGIVCLEGCDGEPQVFDEKEVRVLGKIVGVCNTGRNEEGKMVVESLNI